MQTACMHACMHAGSLRPPRPGACCRGREEAEPPSDEHADEPGANHGGVNDWRKENKGVAKGPGTGIISGRMS